VILHNGEINTIRQRGRMVARGQLGHELLAVDRDKIMPIVVQFGSDSAMLDNTLEFWMIPAWSCPWP
jgi:glutamate synthase (ferredoxin)